MKQVCILFVLVCIGINSRAQISLKGNIVGTDNEPLAGAHVFIGDTYYKGITDNSGNFKFDGIRPGEFKLIISYVGYENYEENLTIRKDTTLQISMTESATISDEVIVSAVRASQNTPTTFTTLSKEDINRRNQAQDLPYVLGLETSVVTTSDAGAGVGYTGLRIRGSDLTRINVTINGVPLNDPESHGVYWVDLPDFASSINSLQLQRGVGSSTNGAGAFGASINIETNAFQSEPFGIISLSAGSFNTSKASFQAGTGLINNHWYFEGRGSAISSEGYIDRASSKLSSFFLQGGYIDNKTLIKAMAFGGKEKTYQAWYGVDKYTLETDRTFNWAGAVFNDNGSVSYYDNQTDNYTQNHYQLHITRKISNLINFNISGHYTYGTGYYEEYQQDDSFDEYNLDYLLFGKDSTLIDGAYRYFYHDTIKTSDIIRRRWLDNHYYGLISSLRYQDERLDLTIGFAVNKYDKAKHFGEVIWAQFSQDIPKDYEYYNNTSFKTDFNTFIKVAWTPFEALTLYGDLQYRSIGYTAHGIESHLNSVKIDEAFHFLNPKIGLSYKLRPGTVYASYSIAHREPIRDDYIDAVEGEKPKHETLGNFELGIRRKTNILSYNINYFLMNYRNQLVLTGEINDDGAFIRRNTGKSYRTGLEIALGYKPFRLFEIDGNMSLSLNKTDYKQTDEGILRTYENTSISFSPSIISGGRIMFFPVKNMEIDWIIKYVGKQYLDNTGNEDRILHSYLLNDTRFAFLISKNNLPAMEITLLVNNIFNSLYESNGYVYGTDPYYYPQAGINFMAGLNIRF